MEKPEDGCRKQRPYTAELNHYLQACFFYSTKDVTSSRKKIGERMEGPGFPIP